MMRLSESGKKTSRQATGGYPPAGSRGVTQYYADNSTLLSRLTSGASTNSGAELRQLSIDLREFATGLFFLGFVALAALPLFLGFLGYRLLIT